MSGHFGAAPSLQSAIDAHDDMSDSSVIDVPGPTTRDPPPVPKRNSLSRATGPPSRSGVHFGDVEILEHERMFMDSPVSGAPRLAQGKMLASHIRRLDSLEIEREPVRHTKDSFQPLTALQRRDLAGLGKEMLADTMEAPVPLPPTPKTDEFDASLDNWHLGADGSVYHTGGVTSKVCGVLGRVVTTAAHGSKYRLGVMKPQVREVLERLSIAFDPESPLANPASLVYAWSIQKLTPEMIECRQRIQHLESKLASFGPSVRECFGTIDKAFAALGFSLSS